MARPKKPPGDVRQHVGFRVSDNELKSLGWDGEEARGAAVRRALEERMSQVQKELGRIEELYGENATFRIDQATEENQAEHPDYYRAGKWFWQPRHTDDGIGWSEPHDSPMEALGAVLSHVQNEMGLGEVPVRRIEEALERMGAKVDIDMDWGTELLNLEHEGRSLSLSLLYALRAVEEIAPRLVRSGLEPTEAAWQAFRAAWELSL